LEELVARRNRRIKMKESSTVTEQSNRRELTAVAPFVTMKTDEFWSYLTDVNKGPTTVKPYSTYNST